MTDEPDEFREPAPEVFGWNSLTAPIWISESCIQQKVAADRMDVFWTEAWRHFGPLFVRYSVSFEEGRPRLVQPLRVDLEQLTFSSSHRRIMRRNADLKLRPQMPKVDDERRQLFETHKQRFKRNAPESLEGYLGLKPGVVPCEMLEMAVYDADKLVAASYLDIGREGASSIYGMFHPAYSRRSLGIGTMLWEMEYARERGCRFYYPGYAFHEPSALDYKKQFTGTEWYDWRGRWLPLAV